MSMWTTGRILKRRSGGYATLDPRAIYRVVRVGGPNDSWVWIERIGDDNRWVPMPGPYPHDALVAATKEEEVVAEMMGS